MSTFGTSLAMLAHKVSNKKRSHSNSISVFGICIRFSFSSTHTQTSTNTHRHRHTYIYIFANEYDTVCIVSNFFSLLVFFFFTSLVHRFGLLCLSLTSISHFTLRNIGNTKCRTNS